MSSGSDPASSACLIEIDNVSKRYGSVQALRDVSIRLDEGELVGLLGPNGSGKTTLVKVMMDLVKPCAGSVRINGAPISEQPPAGQIAAVIEEPAFVPTMTGLECLKMAAIARNADPARVSSMIERLGLGHAAHRKYKTYSMGMKQRLALAQALLGKPQALLVDEPMNGLDPAGIMEIRTILRELADQGVCVLMSSHQIHEVAAICSRIVILRGGCLVAESVDFQGARDLEEIFFDSTRSDEGAFS